MEMPWTMDDGEARDMAAMETRVKDGQVKETCLEFASGTCREDKGARPVAVQMRDKALSARILLSRKTGNPEQKVAREPGF